MQPIRGITVSVEYDDLLEITLVRNMRHLTECVVVTTSTDTKTKEVCAKVPGVKVFETDLFHAYGARFNKGLSLETALQDCLGRHGWILIWDADTLLPDIMPLDLKIGNLYTPKRRILADPTQWTPDIIWEHLPLSNDRAFPGYHQLFHADDPTIQELPWHDLTFAHAGGADGYFQDRWKPENKIRPNYEVLHLGPRDHNWQGRVSKRLDGTTPEQAAERKQAMDHLLAVKGWAGRPVHDPNYSDHVEVPGEKPSGYLLNGSPQWFGPKQTPGN